MLRLITFLEEAAGVELVLPVTPSSYQWAHEAAIETVTVDQLGDLNFFGGKRMGSTTLHDCLLPAQAYPFLSPGAGTNPWLYLEQLERWVDRGTAVAVCNAVERVCGVRPGIKWPNDVILDGRKLCGILTELELEAETAALRHVVVGVGINLTQTAADFGPEVAPVAVSLAQALGRAPRRAEMAAAVLAALDELYAAFPAERAAWLERYRADCLTLGRTVRLLRAGEEEEAFAEAVDDAFALVVRRADGSREAVSSGEVSVRGLLGYV